MAFHSTVFTNGELRRLLKDAGIKPGDFTLASIKGRPARTKGKVSLKGNQVKVFGSDFVATGFIKESGDGQR